MTLKIHEMNNMNLSHSIDLKHKLKHRLMTDRKKQKHFKNDAQASLNNHCTSIWRAKALCDSVMHD